MGSVSALGGMLDLRLYGYSQAVRDTVLIPYAVEADGKLLQPGCTHWRGGYLCPPTAGTTFSANYSVPRSIAAISALPERDPLRRHQPATKFELFLPKIAMAPGLDPSSSAGSQNFGPAGGAASNVSWISPFLGPCADFLNNRVSFLNEILMWRYALTGRTTMVVGGSTTQYTGNRAP